MAADSYSRKHPDGQFYFNLKAGNGETSSPASSIRQRLRNQRHRIRKEEAHSKTATSARQTRAAIPASTSKPPTRVIGSSESYSSESARDQGIESVKSNAPTATIDDQAV